MFTISRRHFLSYTFGAGVALASGVPRPAAADGGQARIVTIGGAITETAIALGAGGQLVGVDTTSLFPALVHALPKVGYLRQLAPEGILSLDPDLVVASDRAGPHTALDQLEAVGVLRLVKDIPSLEGVVAKIHAVGAAIGRDKEAAAVAETVEQDLQYAMNAAAKVTEKPKVAFLHSIGHGAPLAGGRNTPPQALIELSGGVSAFEGFEEYKPVSPEAVIEAAPDVFIVTARSIESFGGKEAFMALPHVAGTPAGRNARIVTIDGLYMLGFGPRTAHAIVDLTESLHPGMSIKPLPARPWS